MKKATSIKTALAWLTCNLLLLLLLLLTLLIMVMTNNVDSSGNFPGVCVFTSDVSVTTVGSIFKGVTV
jgi:hypothetical protein